VIGLLHVPHTILLEALHVVRLYWPIEHTEHATQAADMVMPAPVEYVPAWQLTHAPDWLAPMPVLYVPATHSAQVPEFAAELAVE